MIKLEMGQEINSLLGSTIVTSIFPSDSRRIYLAAVAPPYPPPITTTFAPRIAQAGKVLSDKPSAALACKNDRRSMTRS